MISTDIQTDETMRSVISYGTPEHPICCITDDLSKLKSQSTRWHWHNEFEFSYIRSGAVTFYIDSEQINLQKGDALFISSEAIHHVEGSEGCVVENLIFSPSYLSPENSLVFQKYVQPILQSSFSHLPLFSNIAVVEPVRNKLNHVFSVWEMQQPLWELSLQSATLELWMSIFPMLRPHMSKPLPKQGKLHRIRLQCMMAYIASHYAEQISLEQIAKSAHISTSEALRCFQSGLQTTPVQYLIDYRLYVAQYKLVNSADNITQIAADCGFHTTSYFCRMFRKKYGVTAESYRKMQK